MVNKELTSESEVESLAAEYETKGAEDVLRWVLGTFGSRAAISTSFQAEGMVVIDMACRIQPDVRVFTIDTGRLPQETYNLIDEVRKHYGIAVEVYSPNQDELAGFVRQHGINPFYESVSKRLLCCEIRKVNPLKRVLSNLDAWITGIRRTQSDIRSAAAKIGLDVLHDNMIKVNPVADWTHDRVWEYIRSRGVPHNQLYDQGYTSIGCGPCTRPIQPGEDQRAGRWWWEDGVPKECGIHIQMTGTSKAAGVDAQVFRR